MIKSIVQTSLEGNRTTLLDGTGVVNVITAPKNTFPSVDILSPFCTGKEYPFGTVTEITTKHGDNLISVFDTNGVNVLDPNNKSKYGLDHDKIVYIDFCSMDDTHIGYYLLKLYNLLTQCNDSGFVSFKQSLLRMFRIQPELHRKANIEDIVITSSDGATTMNVVVDKYSSYPINELVSRNPGSFVKRQPLVVASVLLATVLAYALQVKTTRISTDIELIVLCNIQELDNNIKQTLNDVTRALEIQGEFSMQLIITESEKVPLLT